MEAMRSSTIRKRRKARPEENQHFKVNFNHPLDNPGDYLKDNCFIHSVEIEVPLESLNPVQSVFIKSYLPDIKAGLKKEISADYREFSVTEDSVVIELYPNSIHTDFTEALFTTDDYLNVVQAIFKRSGLEKFICKIKFSAYPFS